MILFCSLLCVCQCTTHTLLCLIVALEQPSLRCFFCYISDQWQKFFSSLTSRELHLVYSIIHIVSPHLCIVVQANVVCAFSLLLNTKKKIDFVMCVLCACLWVNTWLSEVVHFRYDWRHRQSKGLLTICSCLILLWWFQMK